MNQIAVDVLIIGSGAAGLSAALNLPESFSIAVLSKGTMQSASTYWAQGGIAAVMDEEDSLSDHVQDTLIAGAGLCHQDAVEFTVKHGRKRIEWLVEQGVKFTREEAADGGDFHLTREGGHSKRRILHSADATGIAVSNALVEQAQAKENIHLYENQLALDLITASDDQGKKRCVGAYVMDMAQRQVNTFTAKFTIMATGGASKAYLYTSNPDVATGDGIAMAWRAGCRVANMEFNQFHPTCLYHPDARTFLITEAVRGEGGHLILPDGERFMPRFDKRAELAPRDIVARAIDYEMKRLGADCVYLDISHKPKDFVISHFPTIYAKCLSYGIDITSQPIPVVPAAHYTCGGVMVDLNSETDIPGLYAIGETSFTGLHGANRMASNSLLECFVFGHAASQHIIQQSDNVSMPQDVPKWQHHGVTDKDEAIIIAHNWDEARRFMWDYVGIVRTDKRLKRAKNRINLLREEIDTYYRDFKLSQNLIELNNLTTVAELIIRCAMMRKESRGLHYTLDYPELLPSAEDSICIPEGFQPKQSF